MKHEEDIVAFHDNIIRVYIKASTQTIPISAKNKCKVIPGWSDYVKDKRDRSLLAIYGVKMFAHTIVI